MTIYFKDAEDKKANKRKLARYEALRSDIKFVNGIKIEIFSRDLKKEVLRTLKPIKEHKIRHVSILNWNETALYC